MLVVMPGRLVLLRGASVPAANLTSERARSSVLVGTVISFLDKKPLFMMTWKKSVRQLLVKTRRAELVKLSVMLSSKLSVVRQGESPHPSGPMERRDESVATR